MLWSPCLRRSSKAVAAGLLFRPFWVAAATAAMDTKPVVLLGTQQNVCAFGRVPWLEDRRTTTSGEHKSKRGDVDGGGCVPYSIFPDPETKLPQNHI